jgi:hypothetical protein
VVRGPAAVLTPPGDPPRRATWRAAAPLIVTAAAWVYFLIPKLLPAISDDDASRTVAGAVATLLIVVVAAGVATLADAPIVVPLILLGAALVTGALNAAGVGAAATVPETVTYSCVGVLFAVWLEAPALALAIPLFVAGIEVISVLGASTHTVAHGSVHGGHPFSLDLPDWHNGLTAARLGLADVVFAGVYAAYARRLGLRFAASAIGMAVGLAVGLGLSVSLNSALPELPFLGAGFLLPNVDRLPGLFRPTGEG